jgi:hypothetical protein
MAWLNSFVKMGLGRVTHTHVLNLDGTSALSKQVSLLVQLQHLNELFFIQRACWSNYYYIWNDYVYCIPCCSSCDLLALTSVWKATGMSNAHALHIILDNFRTSCEKNRIKIFLQHVRKLEVLSIASQQAKATDHSAAPLVGLHEWLKKRLRPESCQMATGRRGSALEL